MPRYKNILLVYPRVPSNTYWSFQYALKFIQKKSAMPPLGLITIAALFPKGYALKLVDLNIEPLKDRDIGWADVVFISAMIVQQESVSEVIARCNRLHKKVVAGGPYANACHEEISGVDHFVLGEVEDTFQGFLKDLENNRTKKLYPPPPHPDISCAPTPRFDLLNLNAYGSMSVQYSRGCPFHCEFCDIWTVYGNIPRLKTAQTMIAEFDALYRIGWRGPVFIVDDNFIGNKRRVKSELLPAIKAWQVSHGRPFHLYTEASINLADDEDLLIAMREAGFNEVFVGIETPDPEGLKETGKVQNLKTDMSQSVRRIQRQGIEVMGGFIVGFDSDKEDIFNRQISFIQENAIPKAMIGLLNALPGTRLYQRLKEEGRILKTSLGNNTHNMTTNFKTMMDSERLKEGYKKILAYIYDFRLKHYFERCNKLFDNMEHREFFQRKIHWTEIRIFLKSILQQPFTPYGIYYLKFIGRNLIRHRDIFAEVITYGIVGHHFHKMTRETLRTDKLVCALDEKYRCFKDLVDRYSRGLVNNSRENLRYVAKLWKTKIKILKQMQARIDKIHRDYRYDLTRRYIDLSRKMEELLNGFEQKALGAG
jgi:radical SAM superfamily enzyme YgiQ (UPF0313 family)